MSLHVQSAVSTALGADALGVQAIAATSAGLSDTARLHMWLRAALNDGCLASHLQLLYSNRDLYTKWFDM